VTALPVSRLDLLRAVSRHRGLLAGGLAAGATAAALGILAPSAAPGVPVLTAARDLAAGTALAPDDLVLSRVPPAAVPDGALGGATEALGRLLAAPVRRGEVLTDVRIAGTALLGEAAEGTLAVPVRLADAAAAALLHAGDRVDVLAAATTPGGPPEASVVADGATVLAVPTAVADGGEGALVVLATDARVAQQLAAAAVSSRLSVVLRRAA
jgi:Flp pilus assembly protein CpaB